MDTNSKYKELTLPYLSKIKAVWASFEDKYKNSHTLHARSQLRGEAMAQEYKLEQDFKKEVFVKFELLENEKSNMAWQLAEDHSDSIEGKLDFFAKMAILIK